MKNYLKITGVIAVTLSMAVPVQADEKFSKEKIAEAEQKEKETTNEKHQLGSFCFYVRPYLTDEERKQIDALLNAGLERSIPVESKRYKESLSLEDKEKKLPEARDILGHIWFSSRPYLDSQEKITVNALIDKGFEKKYNWPSSKKVDCGEVKRVLKFHSSQNPLIQKDEKKVTIKVKETLGHLWLSVRPYLTQAENKNLSDAILKGFDRSIRIQSQQKKEIGKF